MDVATFAARTPASAVPVRGHVEAEVPVRDEDHILHLKKLELGQQVRNGKAKLTVFVSKERVSDHLELTIEVVADEAVRPTAPWGLFRNWSSSFELHLTRAEHAWSLRPFKRACERVVGELLVLGRDAVKVECKYPPYDGIYSLAPAYVTPVVVCEKGAVRESFLTFGQHKSNTIARLSPDRTNMYAGIDLTPDISAFDAMGCVVRVSRKRELAREEESEEESEE